MNRAYAFEQKGDLVTLSSAFSDLQTSRIEVEIHA